MQVNSLGELENKQEEVDTKVFSSSKFANELGLGGLCIITVKFDVAILALYIQQQIGVIFF